MKTNPDTVASYLYDINVDKLTPQQRSHLWNACGFAVAKIKKSLTPVVAPTKETSDETAPRKLRKSEAREPERVQSKGRRDRRSGKGRPKARRG